MAYAAVLRSESKRKEKLGGFKSEWLVGFETERKNTMVQSVHIFCT